MYTEELERTQIKFAMSATTNDPIGFVSRHRKTQLLRGVREDSRFKKKICVLSEELKNKVVPNVLYSVELKPMHNGNGFVAVSAVPVVFPAIVEMEINARKNTYRVLVHFGNKTIIYDPLHGKYRSSRTLKGVLALLRERTDLESRDEVIQQFYNKAEELQRFMEGKGLLPAKFPGL